MSLNAFTPVSQYLKVRRPQTEQSAKLPPKKNSTKRKDVDLEQVDLSDSLFEVYKEAEQVLKSRKKPIASTKNLLRKHGSPYRSPNRARSLRKSTELSTQPSSSDGF